MANPRNLADIAPLVSASGNKLALTNTALLSGGTANGVLYLNGSKEATSGTGLVFDSTKLGIGGTPSEKLHVLNGNVRFEGASNYTGVKGFGDNSISNGTWNWESVTIPGSGVAQFATRFKSITAGSGTTTHNLLVDGSLGVGLGAQLPSTTLDVRGSTSATIRVGSLTHGGSGDEFGNLEFYWGDPDAAEVKAKIYSKNVGNVGPGGGGAANLLFSIRQVGGALDTRLTLANDDMALKGQFSLTDTFGASRYSMRLSRFGYSTGYKALVLGSTSATYNTNITGAVSLSFNYDPVDNADPSFNGDGRELFFRNGTKFVTPNAANNAFNLNNIVLLDGKVGINRAEPGATLDVGGSLIINSGVATFYGSNPARPVTINNDVMLKGETGGWAVKFGTFSPNGTDRGGFGFLGQDNTLDSYWIGPDATNFYLKISSSAIQAKSPLLINSTPASSLYSIDLSNSDLIDNNSNLDFKQDDNDGGNTTISLVENNVIFISNTSGQHSLNWGYPVLIQEGWWRIRGNVRLSSINGNIHINTPVDSYRYSIAFEVFISGGPSSGFLKWDVDALGSGIRAGFTGPAVYCTAGLKQVRLTTDGYSGIKQIYITDLQLERVA